jgi:DNA gyrase subunit A
VKRVELEQFSNVRSNGLRAIELNEEDTLIGVAITDGEQQIMLFSNEGKAIRFAETDVRAMGRSAKGVRGMRVTIGSAQVDESEEVESDEDDAADANFISRIVSLVVVPETGEVLCASANGYGKRTPVDDFPTKKRGGKGVIAIKTSERNGELVGAVAIDETKELMLISDGGTLVRTRASEVAQTGRNAQGVRLIRLGEDETLVGVEAIDAVEEDEIETVESAVANEKLVDEEMIVDETENESDLNESEEE